MTPKFTIDQRRNLLARHCASPADADALLRYNAVTFVHPQPFPHLPLPDEPFAAAWRGYAASVLQAGTLRVLAPVFPQLRFPIAEHIGATPEYKRAVADPFGPSGPPGEPLPLAAPDRCVLELYPSPAGAIATLTALVREDFVALVRAFGSRNKPRPIPDSMGALMIAGYRNLDRMRAALRARGIHPSTPNATQALAADQLEKQEYQDRFILLARSPYSGVGHQAMGLGREDWLETSWLIRREHECVHYFTKRVLGAMRNNILDELLADYAGIVRARGYYDAAWALRFLGLEDYPRYRDGARLENYLPADPSNALSPAAFLILQTLVVLAVRSIAEFDRALRRTAEPLEWAYAVAAIGRLSLEELAGEDAPATLIESYWQTHGAARRSIRLLEVVQ